MTVREWNFDGLIGPTHNYAGLSPGNLASAQSSGGTSHPRRAALQGLSKMARLHALGVPQAILPPQPRPDLDWLRRLGFSGNDARVVAGAAREAPRLLAAAYSASSMWTANAATVVPSIDAFDDRLHLIPANLSSELHRALEAPYTSRLLRAVFPDERLFAHHTALPIGGDEGAANHTRLARGYGESGLHMFVYGHGLGINGESDPVQRTRPMRHRARQSEESSRAAARLAQLDPKNLFFVQQNPAAIDAGVFHNDVIATGDRALVFLHEEAFVDQARTLERIAARFETLAGETLRVVEIPSAALPMARAVETYLFNCQIVARPDGRVAWIGPMECREDKETAALLSELEGPHGPFDELHFVDLRESMRNGGGPACLRLRVVLSAEEEAAMHHGVRFTPELESRLMAVVERHYREVLEPDDLADPALVEEARSALDEIMHVLELDAVYDGAMR